MMNTAGRMLYRHLAECLGLQDRKITHMTIDFASDAPVVTVKTTEILTECVDGDLLKKDCRFELVEKDGDNPAA